MEILAIIPARGGSKRIKDKNILSIAGIPLLAHSIRHALKSKKVNRVIVSTESENIKKVALRSGAEVITRPDVLAACDSTSEDTLKHVLQHLKEKEDYVPDLVVFLQATSPLRKSDDIDLAIETLIREKSDSIFSARHIEGFIWAMDDKIEPVNYDPKNRPFAQQIRKRHLEENGSIYVFKPIILEKTGSRIGGKVSIYPMGILESLQIDEGADIKLVEDIMSILPRSEISPARDIRMLVLDFDGVMTDNRVLVHEDGAEAVLCDRSDGLGLEKLRDTGIDVMVLSKEKNKVVSARCAKLGINCIQGIDDKVTELEAIIKEKGLGWKQVAYVGNDINDIPCMQKAGLPIAVNDAYLPVKSISQVITRKRGGCGAVREVVDLIIKEQGRKG